MVANISDMSRSISNILPTPPLLGAMYTGGGQALTATLTAVLADALTSSPAGALRW